MKAMTATGTTKDAMKAMKTTETRTKARKAKNDLQALRRLIGL